eukprot:3326606-Rhodomonas_salina.3
MAFERQHMQIKEGMGYLAFFCGSFCALKRQSQRRSCCMSSHEKKVSCRKPLMKAFTLKKKSTQGFSIQSLACGSAGRKPSNSCTSLCKQSA